MTVNINNHILRIETNNKTGCVVGEFINDSKLPKIYGDNVKEVLDQAEVIISEVESV